MTKEIINICENCGLPIYEDDPVIYSQGLMCHDVCPHEALEHFKQNRIKELILRGTTEWSPSYVSGHYQDTSRFSYRESDTEAELWPSRDVLDQFDELRFIATYGCTMGEIGSVPVDWETLPRDNNKMIQLRHRVDKRLKELLALDFGLTKPE